MTRGSSDESPSIVSSFLTEMDRVRGLLARLPAWGGVRPGATPHRIVHTGPGISVRHYGAGGPGLPVLLLVAAPIKRPYIWDLSPGASVVERCVHGRVDTYLTQWDAPDESQREFGLDEYADRLILEGLDAIERGTGHRRVIMAGHSLGGTLAALFSALHPERVKGLVLLGAPLCFGAGAGALGRLVAASRRTGIVTDARGNVAGSLLSAAAFAASPATFGWSRWIDWCRSVVHPEALRLHQLVERWTLDEVPMARRLFEDIVNRLYCEDRFMQGTLSVGGRPATATLVEAPLLCVLDERCDIVPPPAMLPFLGAARSPEKHVLWYVGDQGVALRHVGMLVGRHAHESLWPEVIRWMHAQ